MQPNPDAYFPHTHYPMQVKLPGQWDDSPDRLLLEWGTAKSDYADGYREDRKS